MLLLQKNVFGPKYVISLFLGPTFKTDLRPHFVVFSTMVLSVELNCTVKIYSSYVFWYIFSDCVALRDPYCAWHNGACNTNTNRG